MFPWNNMIKMHLKGNRWSSQRWEFERLVIIWIVNTGFCKPTVYQTNRYENNFTKFDHSISKNVSKLSEPKTLQMKVHTLNTLEAIPIIRLSCKLKSVRNTNSIAKRTVKWPLALSIKNSSGNSEFTARLQEPGRDQNGLASKDRNNDNLQRVTSCLLCT